MRFLLFLFLWFNLITGVETTCDNVSDCDRCIKEGCKFVKTKHGTICVSTPTASMGIRKVFSLDDCAKLNGKQVEMKTRNGDLNQAFKIQQSRDARQPSTSWPMAVPNLNEKLSVAKGTTTYETSTVVPMPWPLATPSVDVMVTPIFSDATMPMANTSGDTAEFTTPIVTGMVWTTLPPTFSNPHWATEASATNEPPESKIQVPTEDNTVMVDTPSWPVSFSTAESFPQSSPLPHAKESDVLDQSGDTSTQFVPEASSETMNFPVTLTTEEVSTLFPNLNGDEADNDPRFTSNRPDDSEDDQVKVDSGREKISNPDLFLLPDVENRNGTIYIMGERTIFNLHTRPNLITRLMKNYCHNYILLERHLCFGNGTDVGKVSKALSRNPMKNFEKVCFALTKRLRLTDSYLCQKNVRDAALYTSSAGIFKSPETRLQYFFLFATTFLIFK